MGQSGVEPVSSSSHVRWFVSNSSCVRWCGDAWSCPPRPACDCVGVTVGSDPRSRSAPPHPRSHDSCLWSETFSSMMELVSTFHPHPANSENILYNRQLCMYEVQYQQNRNNPLVIK